MQDDGEGASLVSCMSGVHLSTVHCILVEFWILPINSNPLPSLPIRQLLLEGYPWPKRGQAARDENDLSSLDDPRLLCRSGPKGCVQRLGESEKEAEGSQLGQ